MREYLAKIGDRGKPWPPRDRKSVKIFSHRFSTIDHTPLMVHPGIDE